MVQRRVDGDIGPLVDPPATVLDQLDCDLRIAGLRQHPESIAQDVAGSNEPDECLDEFGGHEFELLGAPHGLPGSVLDASTIPYSISGLDALARNVEAIFCCRAWCGTFRANPSWGTPSKAALNAGHDNRHGWNLNPEVEYR